MGIAVTREVYGGGAVQKGSNNPSSKTENFNIINS
jgi:hypothetical protein